jgi:hypothetical protein
MNRYKIIDIINASIITFLKGRSLNAFSPVIIMIQNKVIIVVGYCLKRLWNGLTRVFCMVPEISKLEDAKTSKEKVKAAESSTKPARNQYFLERVI